MKTKEHGLIEIVRHVLVTGWKKCPLFLALFVLLTMSSGLGTAANVFFKQWFFDAVEALAYGNGRMSHAMVCGLVMAGVMLLTLLLQAVGELAGVNLFQVIMGHMGSALNDKASRVAPIVYEDSRFLDAINKAYEGMEASTELVSVLLEIGLKRATYFVSLGCYFFAIKPMLLVVFVLSFIPVVISSQLRRKYFARLQDEATPYRRKYEYYGKCIYSREYAKETRLWKADDYFEGLYRENLRRASLLKWKTKQKSETVAMISRFISLAGYVGTVLLLFYYLLSGEIGIGAFAAIFSSLDQMYEQMDWVFGADVSTIMEDFGPAQNYFRFLHLEEREGTYDCRLQRREITLRGAGFAYPGSDRKALENISLTVRRGETLAIVGVNGSGKSTLTRLLMGLYLPTEGTVEVDGIDVRQIKPARLYEGVSAVFQKYQCYKMTVGENVRISDDESKREEEAALRQADFPLDAEMLTDGTDTMLGKDFGGIDLSGGQWQRLAIARGLYRVHDMIILDEPTAAIDPIEEAAIYRKFAEISKGRTAVIVTHRLGSVHMADRIVVMDSGKIVDMGGHEELMQRRGLYYQMYQSQAKWYV